MDTTNNVKHQRVKGITMAIIAAALWGIQGNAVDYMFRTTNITLDWIITIRLFYSGVILMAFLYVTKQGNAIFSIWKDRRDSIQLVAFAVLGLLGLQYSFFAAIQHSNAASAAILQYLSPSLLLVYACFTAKRFPERKEIIALILTFFGLFLLVTNGDYTQLSITSKALVWGVASAFALAYYSVQPLKLIQKYNSTVITMWSMFIGSLVISLKTNPFNTKITFSLNEWFIVIFIVITTFVSFYLYLKSLHFITSSEAGLLTVSEPLTSVFIATVVMGIAIGKISLIGGLLIIAVIIMMGIDTMRNEKVRANR